MAIPLLRSGTGLRPLTGFGGRVDPLQQFLPNEQDMAQARAEVAAEDEPNFFFKLLQIPNRLLGGQMIQGFLEGIGNDGLGEGLRKAFVNNPLFQVAEGLGLGEATGNLLEAVGLKEEGSVGLVEDTNFTKVRESFGWDGPDNMIARAAVDIIGEIATSPLEMIWAPFGLTAKGAAKGAAVSADLAKATEQGMKTLLAFKVPFTQKGFTAWTPKALDLYTAKVIQASADLVNSSPITAPLVQLFKANQVQHSSGEARAFVQGSLEQADTAALHLESQALRQFNAITNRAGEDLLYNKHFGELVTIMTEHGIQGVEDRVDFVKRVIEGGDFTPPTRIEQQIAGDIGSPGYRGTTAERAKLRAGELTPAQEAQQTFRQESFPELMKRLDEIGNIDELFDQAKEISLSWRQLSNDLHDIEGINATFNNAMEVYFPRNVDPEVLKALDSRASDYLQQRKFSELTVHEINELARQKGMKATGYRPVGEVVEESLDTASWRFLNEVFNEDFVKGLRKTFGKKAAPVVEFFNTNPFHSFYKRIERAVKNVKTKEMYSIALGKDSLLLSSDRTLGDIMRDPTIVEDIVRSGDAVFEVAEDGGKYSYRKLMDGKLVANTLQMTTRGEHVAARKAIDSWFSEVLTKGSVPFDEAVAELRATAGIRARHIKAAKEGYLDTAENLTELTGRTERLSILESDLAEIEATHLRSHPISKVIRQKVDLLKDWDEAGVKALSEGEQALLRGDGAAYIAEIDGQITNAVGRIDEIKREVAHLREMSKTTKKKGFAERADKLTETRKQLESEVATLRATKGSQKLQLKKVSEKADEARKAKYDHLSKMEDTHRQAVRNELDIVQSQYKDFTDTVYNRAIEKERMVRGVTKDVTKKAAAMRAGQNTREFDDLFVTWRRMQEEGLNPIMEMMETNPELAARYADKFKNTRVVTMDKEGYDAVFDPDKGLLARLSAPDRFGRYLGFLDHFTQFWKSMTLNPVFTSTRARDVMSNTLMAIQGGVKVSHLLDESAGSMTKALFDAFRKGDYSIIKDAKIADDVLEKAGVTNAEEFFDLLYSQKVISPSIVKESYELAVGEKVINLQKGMTLKEARDAGKLIPEILTKLSLQRTGFGQLGLNAAEQGDAYTKVASYISHLRQGKTTEEAGALVRKWSYDPRRTPMSTFERHALRRFIPFYSFARTAIGMQLDAFFKKPGTVTWFEKAQSSLARAADMGPAEQEAFLPEFLKDQFGIPTQRENGVLKVKMFGSFLPVTQLGDIANALRNSFDPERTDGIANYLGKTLNPFLKVPIELMQNESFYLQQPIARFPGQKVEYLGIEMPVELKHTLMSVRFLNEIDNLNILTSEDVKAATELRKGKEEIGFFENLIKNSGISPFSPLFKSHEVDLHSTSDQAQRQEERKLSKLRSEVRSTLKYRPEAQGQNLETLKQLIAKRMAKLEFIEKSSQRFVQ